MNKEELLKLSPGELVDMGICPTCFNLECFFVGNPRAVGHACISTIEHYHDMSEAPDYLNEKIIRYAKRLMNAISKVYGCERVYMCTMCDGLNNHYHVQLIPRYAHEKRGSRNFVKPRGNYIYDEEKLNAVRELIKNCQ